MTSNGDIKWGRTMENEQERETKTHSIINILVMGLFFSLFTIHLSTPYIIITLLIVPRQPSHRSHISGPRGSKRQRNNNGHPTHGTRSAFHLSFLQEYLMNLFVITNLIIFIHMKQEGLVIRINLQTDR
jgi:hypothetical protein